MSESGFELILEFLRVLLTPAPVAAAVVLLAFAFFRSEIRGVLGRIATIKFPGGELSTQRSREARLEGAGETTLTPSATSHGSNAMADAARETQPPDWATALPPDVQEHIRDFVQAERARAALWEYRYLNFYLAPLTQRILDWLAGLQQRTNVGMFSAFWSAIPAEERQAILSALSTHGLVLIDGTGLITVTPKAIEYLQVRGPLPELPAPASEGGGDE